MKTNNDVQFPMERQVFQMMQDNQNAYKSLTNDYKTYKDAVKKQAEELISLISEPKREILQHLVRAKCSIFPGEYLQLGQKDQILQIQIDDGSSLKIRAIETINSRPTGYLYFPINQITPVFDTPSASTDEMILGWNIAGDPAPEEIAKAINTLHELQGVIEAVSSRFPAVYQEALNYMMTDIKNEATYFSNLSQRIKNYQNPLREFEKENDKDNTPGLDPNIIDDVPFF